MTDSSERAQGVALWGLCLEVEDSSLLESDGTKGSGLKNVLEVKQEGPKAQALVVVR